LKSLAILSHKYSLSKEIVGIFQLTFVIFVKNKCNIGKISKKNAKMVLKKSWHKYQKKLNFGLFFAHLS